MEREVVGVEEVSVPTGTFNCYKIVHTTEDRIVTEWWSADDDFLNPVRIVEEATYEFPEIQELASYTS